MKAHAAVAAKAWDSDAKVEAVLANVDTAPIPETLRVTLKLLGKLANDHTVTPDDMKAVLAAGVSRVQIEEALAVSFVFNVLVRLADAFEFYVGPRAHFDIGAKMLLTRGYR